MTSSTVKTNAALLAIAADFARADLAADNIAARLKAVMPEGRSTAEHDAALPILRAGYKTERGCSDDAAKKAIERLCKAAGIVRPKAMSKAATDKAAQRAKGTADAATKVAELTAKADALVAEAEAAKAEGKLSSAKVMLAKAAETQARAELVAEAAQVKSVAEREKAAKAEFKSAASIVSDAMKADASVAALLAWVCENRTIVAEFMDATQRDALKASLATAGEIKPAPLAAKPATRNRKAAGVGM